MYSDLQITKQKANIRKKPVLPAVFILAVLFNYSENDDDGVPEDSFESGGFKFVKGDNGNAFFEGEDTGDDFEESKDTVVTSPFCNFDLGL